MSELDFLVWLERTRSAFGDLVFDGASFLGNQQPYMAILTIIYLCVGHRFGFHLLMLWLVSVYSSAHLKVSFDMVFDNRRPFEMHPELLHPRRMEWVGGASFPSGHTQTAAVVWGTIALRLKSWPFRAACYLLIALTGFSRLYHGVHWPRDVLGGLVIGILLVAGYFGVMRVWQSSEKRLSRGQWAAAIIAASALMYLLSNGLSDCILAAGGLLGAGLGYLLLESRDYQAAAPLMTQVLKAIIALTVLFTLQFGGEKLLGEHSAAWAGALQYALMSFTVAYLLPLLFMQFHAWRSRRAAGQ